MGDARLMVRAPVLGEQGERALHKAARGGHEKVVDMLKAAGVIDMLATNAVQPLLGIPFKSPAGNALRAQMAAGRVSPSAAPAAVRSAGRATWPYGMSLHPTDSCGLCR